VRPTIEWIMDGVGLRERSKGSEADPSRDTKKYRRGPSRPPTQSLGEKGGQYRNLKRPKNEERGIEREDLQKMEELLQPTIATLIRRPKKSALSLQSALTSPL